jgi:hypothetical protein
LVKHPRSPVDPKTNLFLEYFSNSNILLTDGMRWPNYAGGLFKGEKPL